MSTASVVAAGLAAASMLAPNPKPAPLEIARCPYDALELPAQMDLALDATLLVHTPQGSGSAVFISPDGFALTAAHVVQGASQIEVVTHANATLRAQVVRIDAASDVALLYIEAQAEVPCLRAATQNIPLGSEVFALGSPAGDALAFSVTKGVVSAYRDFEDVSFVQLDASLNSGNSGGPIVDEHGNIVGIASWKIASQGAEGLAFGVPPHRGLDKLAVEVTEHTQDNWASSVPPPRSLATSTQSYDDSSLRDEGHFDASKHRRFNAQTVLLATGGTALGLGAIAIPSMYFIEEARPHIKIPISIAAGGMGVLIAGAAWRVSDNRSNRRARVTPRSGGLSVRF